MSSEEEINQLRETIQNAIVRDGIDKYLHTQARHANVKFEQQEDSTITLDRETYGLLKLMMIDYIKK